MLIRIKCGDSQNMDIDWFWTVFIAFVRYAVVWVIDRPILKKVIVAGTAKPSIVTMLQIIRSG